MSDEVATKIMPMLSLRGAARASEFYQRAFGARELSRVTSPEGRVVALLAIGDAEFGAVDETPQMGNLSPETLGGTSVESACMWQTWTLWHSERSTQAPS